MLESERPWICSLEFIEGTLYLSTTTSQYSLVPVYPRICRYCIVSRRQTEEKNEIRQRDEILLRARRRILDIAGLIAIAECEKRENR